jgi:hypothetical protein
MQDPFKSNFRRFCLRIEHCRLVASLPLHTNAMAGTTDGLLSANAKSSIYVFLGAAIESQFKGHLEDLVKLIVGRGVNNSRLTNRISPLLYHNLIESVSVVKHEKRASKIIELLDLSNSRAPAKDSHYKYPLDSRTIRQEHYKNIWSILGLDGYHLPSGTHAIALENIADERNNYAHGDKDPSTDGHSINASDLVNLVNKTQEIGEHYYSSMKKWVADKRHLR